MKRFSEYVLPLILWAGVIFLLSEQKTLPIPVPTGMDKVGHVGIYAVFGLLTAHCFSGYGINPWASWGLAVGMAAIYGATDELHQLLNPPRTADIRDWVADVTGGTLGGLIYLLLTGFGKRAPAK